MWTENADAIEPGEKTSIKLGTAADNLFVIQQLDKETSNLQLPTPAFPFLNSTKKNALLNFLLLKQTAAVTAFPMYL
ncbi:MAG: hypothetical protein WDO16_05505 [Bacteroidota bacterium]